MNRLTRLTTVTACAVFFFLSLFTSSAQAQFLGLQSEVLAETELGTTYRVYAEFASASDECIAVYSVGTSECVENDENNNCIQMGPLLLELGVTTAFFQHPAAGDMGSGINPFFFPFYPEMEYDSWLTIGSSSTNDEAVSNIGMVSDLAEFASGTGFVMDETVGGSWYVTPGANPAAMAGDDGLVLLGQFTAVDDANGNPGHVTCLWNIQWRNNVGVSFKETGITHDTSGDGTVSGCMDASACNYNASATASDDGCAFATGCDVCGGNATDGTGSVVDNDADNDGVCDVDEIAGCQNSAACNYNASATDAATCLYATGCDVCAGNPTNGTGTVLDLDADNDGVCDEDEIAGCQNSSACNYDASATDSGTACVFPFGCETCSGETNGTGTVVDNDSDGDGVCDADEISGCQVASACNYNASATDAGTVCIYAAGCESCSGPTDGTGTILANDDDNDGVCNADEIAGCQNSAACNYNASATDAADCIFATGCDECQGNPTDGTGSVNDLDADNDGVCDADEIAGCQSTSACNYNASATDSATCLFATGCDVCAGNATDGTGTVTDLDADNDGVCDADEIAGCQSTSACNYNASATDSGSACIFPSGCETCSGATDGTGTVLANDDDDDGVCNADEIAGCQNSNACNYDESATDGGVTCVYATGCETCSGATDGSGTVVDNDADNDSVCDADEVAGCQNSTACNYNASATDPGATCIFPQGCETCSGETNGNGTIVDNDADNDGVCDADETAGCQDNTACNYDANATNGGIACVYASGCDYCSGETDGSGTIVNGDVDADDVCDVNEIPGCQDPVACNYNEAATDEDNSCTYEVLGYDCNGDCLFDDDEDGVCDQWEITGCQDEAACNYEATATNAGYCDYPATNYDCDENCLNDADGDGLCDELESAGCLDSNACNYDASATDNDGSCTYAATGYDCAGVCLADTDGDEVCDANEVAGCTDGDAMNFNALATDDNGSCVYCEDADNDGVCDNELVGCTDSAACNYDATSTENDGSCMYAAAGYGCDGTCLADADEDGVCDANEVAGCADPSACNFAAAATDDDGSCTHATTGFDCDGACLVDSDQDGICDQDEVTGCQDSAACNYDEAATDNGYCDYPMTGYDCEGNCLPGYEALCNGGTTTTEVLGCMDSAACNYAATATQDNGSCTFADAGYDCDGVCLFDEDGDGICNAFEVPGCTDCAACNFAASATDDDNSCTYAEAGIDCDGGCLVDSDGDFVCDQNEITGCQDSSACNFDETATDAGYCDYAETNYDCAGNCLNDADGDGVCDEFEPEVMVLGCTSAEACNYDATATDDNGSCSFADTGYDCTGECLADSDGDGVCDAFEVLGCTDCAACNFAASATDDDSSCIYASAGYGCDGGCLVDSDQDGICDQDEVAGCPDAEACNYDPLATDDGYCDYASENEDCDGNCLNDVNANGICDELEDGLTVGNNCAAATEEFMAALASGLYCGDGTVWVDAVSECMVIPTCFADLDNNGNRGTEDLLIMLSVFGAECDLAEGCMDPLAENYDPFAVVDDNSCIVLEDPCALATSITYQGEDYALVSVGDQCWFRDNLASDQFQNGDAIGLTLESTDWYAAANAATPAFAPINGDGANTAAHGYLYNGYAVNDARGLCPSDWHVASDGDWMSLEAALGMDSLALADFGDRGTDQGDQLKSSASDDPAWDGTNVSGFSGTPSGQRYSFGSFNGFGTMSLLWTGTNSGSSNWARKLESDNAQVQRSLISKGFGGSVRCVMD